MMRVSVIGLGTMGVGICHAFASKGFEVDFFDKSIESVESTIPKLEKILKSQNAKGIISEQDIALILTKLHKHTSLISCVKHAEVVVEAIRENEEDKLNLFNTLSTYAPNTCILASNTSSISITKIANVVQNPSRVVGVHFMNPVHRMTLVELVRCQYNSPEIINTCISIIKKLEKVPVLANDFPGFVSNRILMPMINEAILCLEQGVSTLENIDAIMELGMAHPMGPLKLADLIGLDVCESILLILQNNFGDHKYAPAQLLKQMVASGFLGQKSGKGFYDYTQGKEHVKPSDFYLLKERT